MFVYSSSLDLLFIFWYLTLVDCRSEKFELDCLILNFLLAPFNSVLACFMSLLHQPFLVFFDVSVRPKYLVAVVTMMLVNKFVCFSISSSVMLSGELCM